MNSTLEGKELLSEKMDKGNIKISEWLLKNEQVIIYDISTKKKK